MTLTLSHLYFLSNGSDGAVRPSGPSLIGSGCGLDEEGILVDDDADLAIQCQRRQQGVLGASL
jgi:hypothetical protein